MIAQVRTHACALEVEIRSALAAHPLSKYPNFSPEALSVCRYTDGFGVARYKAIFPEAGRDHELEPQFLPLTSDPAATWKVLNRFRGPDFMKLQAMVDCYAQTVTKAQMRAATDRYKAAMATPDWKYHSSQLKGRA